MPLHLIFHTALKVGFCGEVHSSSKYLFSYYFPHYHLNLASLHSGLTGSKALTLAIPWAWDTVAPKVSTCLLSHLLQGFACVHEDCLETLISTCYTNHLLSLLLCSAILQHLPLFDGLSNLLILIHYIYNLLSVFFKYFSRVINSVCLLYPTDLMYPCIYRLFLSKLYMFNNVLIDQLPKSFN